MIAPLVSLVLTQAGTPDVNITPLSGGFVRVTSKEYSVEVPQSWTVGNQTPWGARSITASKNSNTELGVMTAGVTKKSWDDLYQTSLFFILRQEKGKATPYRLGKTKTGYEACSFEVANEAGFVNRKYVLLKSPHGSAIALSVIIGEKSKAKEIGGYFDRMVQTAKIIEAG